jgi:hypothetical protein
MEPIKFYHKLKQIQIDKNVSLEQAYIIYKKKSKNDKKTKI